MLRNRSLLGSSVVCLTMGVLSLACNSVPTDLHYTGAAGQLNAGNILGQDDTPITPGEVAPFLPESVALDISELPEQASAAVPQYEHFANDIRVTGHLIRESDQYISRALTLAASIRDDMIGPDQVHVTGTLDFNGTALPYMADFSPFDIDDDEIVDGSGSAVVEPVALRVWVDRGEGYKRFVCALVPIRPSKANLGAGRIITRPNTLDPVVPPNFRIEARWNHTDPDHVRNEIYRTTQLDQLSFVRQQLRLDFRSVADDSVEKNFRIWGGTITPGSINSWGTSMHVRAGLPRVEIAGNCLSLPVLSGDIGGEFAECDSFDLRDDTGPLGGSDANFPLDFPLKPTF